MLWKANQSALSSLIAFNGRHVTVSSSNELNILMRAPYLHVANLDFAPYLRKPNRMQLVYRELTRDEVKFKVAESVLIFSGVGLRRKFRFIVKWHA